MRRIPLAMGLLAFTFLSTPHAADVDYVKAVAAAQEASDLASLNRLCNEWAAAAPGDERPRLILGQTLAKAGMPDRALEQFELATEANPLSPGPRCEIGGLFLGAGKADAAMAEFTEVLRHHPGHLPALLGCVHAQLRKGDVNGALTAVRRALKASPDDASVKAALGECLWRLGKPGEARTQLTAALEADPGNADALFGWARALQSEGKDQESVEAWQRFLAREPSGPRAERVRNGWAVLSEERLPRACRAYPRWSPDGRRIMFGYGRLRSIELDSKAITDVREPGNEKLYVHDWSPDGRRLALDTPRGILIVRLGGLGLSPVGIAAKRAGATLSVTVTSRSEEAQQADLRWEFFDSDSLRIGPPGETDESVDLASEEGVEFTVDIPAADVPKVRTAEVRALNQVGTGAVALVDCGEEG